MTIALVQPVLGLPGDFFDLFAEALLALLGPRHREPATGAPYEGGILSEGSAHVRLSAKFYLIAMFFVVQHGEGHRSAE